MTKSVFTTKYDKFRQLLIEARKHSGLHQHEVAKRLGRQQSFVSNYERGIRRLDVIEFFEVALALGTDPHGILKKLFPKH